MRYLFLILLFISCNDTPKNNNGGTTDNDGGVIKPPPIDVVIPTDTIADFRLNWPDRRPIGMLMLSTAPTTEEAVELGNRNWKLGGQMQFSRLALFSHARESIKNCKQLNAQGVIIWDLEGQEFFHPISYMGAPDQLALLAPEMDSLADRFFDLFKEAGLRTGVCIRPDEITWYGLPKSIYWHSVSDPLISMRRKIKYCIDRWGCSLFYIDSNVYGDGGTMPGSIFKKLASEFPNVLIMPEWEAEQADYWQATAPFKWLRQYRVDVDPKVKAVNPNAFMVLSVGDADGDLKKAITEGNILMFRAWYDSPEIDKIKIAYDVK